MSENLKIELSPEYAAHLELLKQVIPNSNGEQITDDGKMIEALIDSFTAFIQEQAGMHNHDHGNGGCGGHGGENCCGGKNHDPEKEGQEGCGCH